MAYSAAETIILQRKEIVVQLLSSEPKKTTMKYTKVGPREFVPFNFDEITIENITTACQQHFHEVKPCDILASEQGPSCTRIDQLTNFKIIYIRFTGHKSSFDDLTSKQFSVIAQHHYLTPLSKIPYQHNRRPVAASHSAITLQRAPFPMTPSEIPRSLSIVDMLKLGKLQKKDSEVQQISVETFNISKKEWICIGDVSFDVKKSCFRRRRFSHGVQGYKYSSNIFWKNMGHQTV